MRATTVAALVIATSLVVGVELRLPALGAVQGRALGAVDAKADATNGVRRTADPASAGLPLQEKSPTQSMSPDDLKAAIDQLSGVDYAVRTTAARRIRRAPAAEAVPALRQAAREDKDGYVRYRALVLLTGFGDPSLPDVMTAAVGDKNDRIREVGYEYIEHHPDPRYVALLLRALREEGGEFVRPALLRALAAHGSDASVRTAVVPEIARGETMFRSALIEALGDYRGDYALPQLVETVQSEGPLQVDAAIALGKIGDSRALPAVVAAQKGAPSDVQPQIAAAICLLGLNCAAHVGYIDKTLRFASQNANYQPLLRGAAAAAGALAQRGNADAAALLFDVGVGAEDPARAPIALALGAVALRSTPVLLSTLEKRTDAAQAVLLLRDSFDMLEEPYAKERFFVAVRHAYWDAAEGSERRKVAQLLIEKLEF